MGIRASRDGLARSRSLTALPLFPVSVFLLLWGCASPGEPVERRAPVPAAITDLAAEQSGNSAALTFALPRETIEHRLLKQPPDIEIYRDFSSAGAGAGPAGSTSTAQPASPTLLVTIPSALVSHYEQQGRIRYVDEWTPEVLKQHAIEVASYMIRTRASRKKTSPDSNIASLHVYPAAEPIADLKAELASSAVKLTWTAPQQTPTGPAPPIKEYRVYRAELSSGAPSEKPSAEQLPAFPIAGTKQAEPRLEKIVETESPVYQDTEVAVGATYEYSVRSVVEYGGEQIESSDSNLATITMRDVFPPSAPTGLVVVYVPAQGTTHALLDLSWAVNSETDVAGYNVYRSEQEGTRGHRLNSQLLPTPAFSDMSTVTGQRYFYTVTAVDRSGNESEPSAAASGEVPAESQP
jgi:hypothetical protein